MSVWKLLKRLLTKKFTCITDFFIQSEMPIIVFFSKRYIDVTITQLVCYASPLIILMSHQKEDQSFTTSRRLLGCGPTSVLWENSYQWENIESVISSHVHTNSISTVWKYWRRIQEIKLVASFVLFVKLHILKD